MVFLDDDRLESQIDVGKETDHVKHDRENAELNDPSPWYVLFFIVFCIISVVFLVVPYVDFALTMEIKHTKTVTIINCYETITKINCFVESGEDYGLKDLELGDVYKFQYHRVFEVLSESDGEPILCWARVEPAPSRHVTCFWKFVNGVRVFSNDTNLLEERSLGKPEEEEKIDERLLPYSVEQSTDEMVSPWRLLSCYIVGVTWPFLLHWAFFSRSCEDKLIWIYKCLKSIWKGQEEHMTEKFKSSDNESKALLGLV